MKSKQKSTPEYKNFEQALSTVLKVPHSEMRERIEQEKKEKPPTKRASSSGRASGGKD